MSARRLENQGALVARRRVRARETSAKSTENLQDLLQPHLPAAIQTWVDGLGATKIAWNGRSETWVDTGFPDWKERRESARAIVEYLVGKAIERSLEVSGSYRELSDVLKSLEQSPEARRLLSPELFNSLRRASNDQSAQQPHEEKDISELRTKNTVTNLGQLRPPD